MTEAELTALLQSLAPVVREYMTDALAGLADRVADLRDRVIVVETKAALPPDVGAVRDELGLLRERVAVAELRPLLPGPPGKDGQDGRDGFTCDDLICQQDPDDDRRLTLQYVRGTERKTIGTLRLPTPKYLGVYVEGQSYEPGDQVTWAGSQWYCHATTATKPGNGNRAWTLQVKCGRDGKDGRDGRDAALPVVKVT